MTQTFESLLGTFGNDRCRHQWRWWTRMWIGGLARCGGPHEQPQRPSSSTSSRPKHKQSSPLVASGGVLVIAAAMSRIITCLLFTCRVWCPTALDALPSFGLPLRDMNLICNGGADPCLLLYDNTAGMPASANNSGHSQVLISDVLGIVACG